MQQLLISKCQGLFMAFPLASRRQRNWITMFEEALCTLDGAEMMTKETRDLVAHASTVNITSSLAKPPTL